MPSFLMLKINEEASLPSVRARIRERELNVKYGEVYKSAGFVQLDETGGDLHGFVVSAVPASYRELISSEEGPVAQIKKRAVLAHAEFGLHHNIIYIGNPRERAFRDFLLGTVGRDIKLEHIRLSPEAFSYLEENFVSRTHSLGQIRRAGDSTRKVRYEIDPAEQRGTSRVKELYWDPMLAHSIEILVEYQKDFFPVTFYADGIIRLDSRKLPGVSDRLPFLRHVIDMSTGLYLEFPPQSQEDD